jgi:Mg2+/Co2+ transporter CorB
LTISSSRVAVVVDELAAVEALVVLERVQD